LEFFLKKFNFFDKIGEESNFLYEFLYLKIIYIIIIVNNLLFLILFKFYQLFKFIKTLNLKNFFLYNLIHFIIKYGETKVSSNTR
jgi:hypothetical protein